MKKCKLMLTSLALTMLSTHSFSQEVPVMYQLSQPNIKAGESKEIQIVLIDSTAQSIAKPVRTVEESLSILPEGVFAIDLSNEPAVKAEEMFDASSLIKK